MAVIEYHNAGNSEAQQQQALAYLLAQTTQGRAAAGVLSGLTVTQTTTASGAVQVATGAAVAQASASAGAGLLVNDAQATLNVLSGTGSTPMGATPRNDVVWIDRATLAIGYTAGVPNAVPTDPAIPATAVRLARLRHAANATTIPTSAIENLQTPTTLAPADTATTQTRVLSSDDGWPKALSGITPATPEVNAAADRISIPAAPYARKVTISATVYVTPPTAGANLQMALRNGGVGIGRAQKTFHSGAAESVTATGYVLLSAGSSAVIEARLVSLSAGSWATRNDFNNTTMTATIAPA